MKEYTFIVQHFLEENGTTELVGEETSKQKANSYEEAEDLAVQEAEIFRAECESTYFNLS